MKDINIGTIRPLAEPRSGEKPARKEQVGGQNFSQTLEKAVMQANEIARQSAVGPTGADATGIQKDYSAAKQQFDTLMRVEQQLRQLHRTITAKPTQDEN